MQLLAQRCIHAYVNAMLNSNEMQILNNQYLVDNSGSNAYSLANIIAGSNKWNVVKVATDNNETLHQQLHFLQ
jgi:hypothetical protein